MISWMILGLIWVLLLCQFLSFFYIRCYGNFLVLRPTLYGFFIQVFKRTSSAPWWKQAMVESTGWVQLSTWNGKFHLHTCSILRPCCIINMVRFWKETTACSSVCSWIEWMQLKRGFVGMHFSSMYVCIWDAKLLGF